MTTRGSTSSRSSDSLYSREALSYGAYFPQPCPQPCNCCSPESASPTTSFSTSSGSPCFCYSQPSSGFSGPCSAYCVSGTMDGLNECRTARVAEVLSDFRTLQYYIAAAPAEPSNLDDYYTEGWSALRQCAMDGQHILECAADTRVPNAQGAAEQTKAELKQVLLDAYSRRHEGQKIYLRQEAVQRWIDTRDQILMGQRPHGGNQAQLQGCDRQLRVEIAAITDQFIYAQLLEVDQHSGRWTNEDPSLRGVMRWLQARR